MRVLRLFSNDALWPYLAPILRPLTPIRKNPSLLFTRTMLCVPAYVAFVALNVAHATVRGYGDNIAPFDAVNVAEFDIALFGTVPSVNMQEWLGTSGLWAEFGFLYWTTLFWVPTLLVATIVLARGRGYFMRLLLLHMALVLSADVIYNIVPTRPPWMDVDVVRIIAVQSAEGVHIDRNPFAALPSLHVAVPLVYALWFRGFEPTSHLRRLAPVLGVWAAGMSWCVMYTGEHYFIDVVTGYIWGLMVFYPLHRLGLLHPKRGQAPEYAEQDATPPLVTAPQPASAERAA